MRINAIRHGSPSRFTLRPADGAALPTDLEPGAEVGLLHNPALAYAALRCGDRYIPVEANSPREADALAHVLHTNLPRVAWIAARGDATIVVQLHQFTMSLAWPEPLQIGVDDRLVDDARKCNPALRQREDVLAWLAAELLVREPGQPPRALVSGSPVARADLHRAFRVHGARWNLDVVTRDDGKLLAHRLVAARGHDFHPVTLVAGDLQFVDVTAAAAFIGAARHELDALVQGAAGYLALWREYNALDREAVLRRARAFGIWPYDRLTYKGDDLYEIHMSPDAPDDDRLWTAVRARDIEVALAVDAPPELRGRPDPGVPREEFLADVIQHHHSRRTLVVQARDDEQRRPPKQGELYLSIVGDKVRLRRRDDAFKAIAAATCPMPQLGFLIEGRYVPERRSRAIEPLSPGVLRVFGGRPTDRQIEALRVALNTPDIALIQGPPGTGKTRTIAALQVRLAELAGEAERVSRHILLTSFQHDAVENVASKTRVLGLPALKLGGRARGGALDPLDDWLADQATDLRADLARGGERPVDAVLRDVRDWTIAYCQAPSPRDDPASLLDRVARVAAPHIPGVLLDEVRSARDDLRRPPPQADDDHALLRKSIRALRTSAAAFADDGPHNASMLRLRLEQAGLLGAAEAALLTRAAEMTTAPTDLLADLASLQRALQDRLAPRRATADPTVNVDVERLLHAVLAALHDRARTTAEGVESALRDHLHDLEHDPEGAREAILQYTAVLAATCQQAVSKPVFELKDDGLVFTTVIVDEAARANPLDLMIPMARAERRIVLVGDHRQLPHLLEPDVEQALDQGAAAATQDALRRSLFERLFLDLQQREHDGIRRTVTLDRQFRMHPALGRWVSDTFYADHGEAFDSGTRADELRHDLPAYGNAVAAWIDVPLARGPESDTASKYRVCEARVAAAEAKKILVARPELSVGVISFYSAQVDEILAAMVPLGLAEMTPDGYEIRGEWARTQSPGRARERLRVGTVDAFQGMEFDVVLLSMTRANDRPANDHRAVRRKYGHLTLANRLCVAMSRQQRLLVVIGDRAMLAPPAARRELRGLVNFSNLCEGAHGLVRRA